jgi:hypothetical protein
MTLTRNDKNLPFRKVYGKITITGGWKKISSGTAAANWPSGETVAANRPRRIGRGETAAAKPLRRNVIDPEEWIYTLLCSLQATERRNEEGQLLVTTHRRYPKHVGGITVVFHTRSEWLLAGGCPPGRQGEDGVFYWWRSLPVQRHAIWSLQRSCHFREIDVIRSARIDVENLFDVSR